MNLACASCGTTNRVPEQKLGDQPICGRCGAELLPAAPVSLTDATMPNFVAKTEMPVLVDFWAEWCGPCKMMAPHFATAAAQERGVRFAKLDTDANPQASATHAIRGIPTMILFRNGREAARISGAMSSGQLLGWLHAQLAPAGSR